MITTPNDTEMTGGESIIWLSNFGHKLLKKSFLHYISLLDEIITDMTKNGKAFGQIHAEMVDFVL